MASLPQRVGAPCGCSTEELVVLDDEEEEVMVVDKGGEERAVRDTFSTDRNTRCGRKLRLGSDATSRTITRPTKSSR